jgi:signal transduction histidine kinase
MRLKTGLQLGAVFPIVLALLVSLILAYRSAQHKQAQALRSYSEEIVRRTSGLNVVAYRYLLKPDAVTQAEWLADLMGLQKSLSEMPVDSVSAQILIEGMKENVKATKSLAMLVAAAPTLTPEQKERSRKQLMANVEGLLQTSERLDEIVKAGLKESEESRDLVLGIVIAVLGLGMAALAMVVFRATMGRIDLLLKWSDRVAKGDHGFNAEGLTGTDEIGQIYYSMNTMTRHVSASSRPLLEEIDSHKKSAEASRESSVKLSEALVKLKRAQSMLVQQERTRALEQIAKGVIHGFNDRLMAILGEADLLSARPELLANPKDAREHLKLIAEAALEASREVKNLSEFFRPTKWAESQPVALNDVVEKALHFSEPRWRGEADAKGIHINIRKQLAHVPPVMGDAVELQQVVNILLMNAIDAMPKGGDIQVVTAFSGKEVTMQVIDGGEGMTEEVRERCLEPFFSTRGPEGTGMGLTVASGTVRRFGGTLDLESRPGRGTTVTVKLQAVVDRKAPEVPTAEAAPLPQLGILNVLVVDDRPWACQTLSRILSVDGHKVSAAFSGKDALKLFPAGGYDLVILDRAMPDLSGDEVALQIREMSPETPVIMMTGFGDIMIERDERPPGVDHVVPKPVAPDELRRAIARVMVRRRNG